MQRLHGIVPPIQTGYELSREGFFALIQPEATTNLITNPSVERATTGYTLSNGATIARSTAKQWRGAASLAITPSSNVASGAYYTTSTLVSGTTYAFSVAVWGAPGVPYRITIATTGAVVVAQTTFYGTGTWQRISVIATVSSSAAHRLYVEKNGGASTAVFYADAWQLEAKTYPTTYCDGDQAGFVATRADFRWTGTPHASTSTRSAQCRAGGRLVKLSDLGFRLTGYVGLGMAAVSNLLIPAGLTGGSYYQTTLPQDRQVALIGRMGEASLPQLQRRRAALEDVLRFDATDPPQPLVLRYEARDACDEPLYNPLLLTCAYTGGLEGQTDNLYSEQVTLAFQSTYLPFLVAEGESGAALDVYESLDFATRDRLVYRAAGGGWVKLDTSAAASATVAIYVIAQSPLDGKIYIGGDFSDLGGVLNATGICYIDPSTGAITAMSTGVSSGAVHAIAFDQAGNVWLGGTFGGLGGVANTSNIGYWTGSAYVAAGTGVTLGSDVYALLATPDGRVYAGGDFTQMSGVANTTRLAYYDGSWHPMGTGANGAVRALVRGLDGIVYIGGSFTTLNAVANTRIGRWLSTDAYGSAMGAGADDVVRVFLVLPNGMLVIGGDFDTLVGVTVNRIGQWNGTSILAMDGGVGGGGDVDTLAYDTTREILLVGGDFTSTGSDIVTNVDGFAYWLGTTWVESDTDGGATATTALYAASDGTIWRGFSVAGTGLHAGGVVTVTPGGNAKTYPTIEILGASGALVLIENRTTGRAVYFRRLSITSSAEVVTLVFQPDALSFTSNVRGDISSFILPGSEESDFFLQPGPNVIYVACIDATGNTGLIRWRDAYHSVDAATP